MKQGGSEQSRHLSKATRSTGTRRWAVGEAASMVDPKTEGQEPTRTREESGKEEADREK